MDVDATRLASLYREVGPSLLGYLRRLVGDLHEAEEALQETFLQATRHAERFSAALSARAWLFGVARHLALTRLRRHRGTRALPADVAAAEADEDPRLERVRRGIAELPDVLRETLELRLRCELTYEEIADVLRIPVGTVRSRLHDALRRLRDAVAEAHERRRTADLGEE